MNRVWDWKVEAKILSIVIHTDSNISLRKTNKILVSASQVMLVIKNPLANAGDIRDTGSIPGSGRSPGEGNGNPLQYSCSKNPMDRGALCTTVHGGHKELDMIEHLSHIRPSPAASAALSALWASLS